MARADKAALRLTVGLGLAVFVAYGLGLQAPYVFRDGGKFRMFYGDAMSREKRGNGWKSQSCFRCFTGPNFAAFKGRVEAAPKN